jgi:peptidoglycan pentaglycine glycine transferase (the first glycine)
MHHVSRIYESRITNPEQITDPEQWNTALARLPTAHVLQTWEWGAFKSRHGWRPIRYLWLADDRPCAAASVLTRWLTHGLRPVMYVPKGPAMEYGDIALLERILGDLENIARHKRALFVKIDPDVRADTTAGKAVVETLRRRGWRFSREQIQFRNTVLLDLTRSPDELLAAMKSKWRYNVRLAARKGVTVRRGTAADLPLLYCMYAETAARDGFVIRPEDYYRDAWSTFIEAGLAQPLIAEVEGEAVAMVIIFHFPSAALRTSPSAALRRGPSTALRRGPSAALRRGPSAVLRAGSSTALRRGPSTALRAGAGRAWYMYGASRAIHREKMPNHLLQWEAIQWAREQGCAVYDMWGAPDVLDESDLLWGVYRFKRGFGGEFVQHIGAWDFPVSRPGYWLYTTVMPRVLAAMRWRYRKRLGVSGQPRAPQADGDALAMCAWLSSIEPVL